MKTPSIAQRLRSSCSGAITPHGKDPAARHDVFSEIREIVEVAFLFFQLDLQLQPRHPRHAEVNDQARAPGNPNRI
jgi:hypothetical protein